MEREVKEMKEFWNAIQFVFAAIGGWLVHCIVDI